MLEFTERRASFSQLALPLVGWHDPLVELVGYQG